MPYLYLPSFSARSPIVDENGAIIHELVDTLDEYPVEFTISNDFVTQSGYISNVDRRHTYNYYRTSGLPPALFRTRATEFLYARVTPTVLTYPRLTQSSAATGFSARIVDVGVIRLRVITEGRVNQLMRNPPSVDWELTDTSDGFTEELLLRSSYLYTATDGTVVADVLNSFVPFLSQNFDDLYRSKRTQIFTVLGSFYVYVASDPTIPVMLTVRSIRTVYRPVSPEFVACRAHTAHPSPVRIRVAPANGVRVRLAVREYEVVPLISFNANALVEGERFRSVESAGVFPLSLESIDLTQEIEAGGNEINVEKNELGMLLLERGGLYHDFVGGASSFRASLLASRFVFGAVLLWKVKLSNGRTDGHPIKLTGFGPGVGLVGLMVIDRRVRVFVAGVLSSEFVALDEVEHEDWFFTTAVTAFTTATGVYYELRLRKYSLSDIYRSEIVVNGVVAVGRTDLGIYETNNAGTLNQFFIGFNDNTYINSGPNPNYNPVYIAECSVYDRYVDTKRVMVDMEKKWFTSRISGKDVSFVRICYASNEPFAMLRVSLIETIVRPMKWCRTGSVKRTAARTGVRESGYGRGGSPTMVVGALESDVALWRVAARARPSLRDSRLRVNAIEDPTKSAQTIAVYESKRSGVSFRVRNRRSFYRFVRFVSNAIHGMSPSDRPASFRTGEIARVDLREYTLRFVDSANSAPIYDAIAPLRAYFLRDSERLFLRWDDDGARVLTEPRALFESAALPRLITSDGKEPVTVPTTVLRGLPFHPRYAMKFKMAFVHTDGVATYHLSVSATDTLECTAVESDGCEFVLERSESNTERWNLRVDGRALWLSADRTTGNLTSSDGYDSDGIGERASVFMENGTVYLNDDYVVPRTFDSYQFRNEAKYQFVDGSAYEVTDDGQYNHRFEGGKIHWVAVDRDTDGSIRLDEFGNPTYLTPQGDIEYQLDIGYVYENSIYGMTIRSNSLVSQHWYCTSVSVKTTVEADAQDIPSHDSRWTTVVNRRSGLSHSDNVLAFSDGTEQDRFTARSVRIIIHEWTGTAPAFSCQLLHWPKSMLVSDVRGPSVAVVPQIQQRLWYVGTSSFSISVTPVYSLGMGLAQYPTHLQPSRTAEGAPFVKIGVRSRSVTSSLRIWRMHWSASLSMVSRTRVVAPRARILILTRVVTPRTHLASVIRKVGRVPPYYMYHQMVADARGSMHLYMDASHPSTKYDIVTKEVTQVLDLMSNSPFSMFKSTPTDDRTSSRYDAEFVGAHIRMEEGGIRSLYGHLYFPLSTYTVIARDADGSYSSGHHFRSSVVYVGKYVSESKWFKRNPNWATFFHWASGTGAPFFNTLTLQNYGATNAIHTQLLQRKYSSSTAANGYLWLGSETTAVRVLHASYSRTTASNNDGIITLRLRAFLGGYVFPVFDEEISFEESLEGLDESELSRSENEYNMIHIGGYGNRVHSASTTTMEARFYKDILSAEEETAVVSELMDKWSKYGSGALSDVYALSNVLVRVIVYSNPVTVHTNPVMVYTNFDTMIGYRPNPNMISFMRSRSFNADNRSRVKSVRIVEYGALVSSIRIHAGIRMDSTQYYSHHSDGRYTPVRIGYVNRDSLWLITDSNTYYGLFRTDKLPLLVTNDPSPKTIVSDTLPIVRYSYTGTIGEVETLYRLSIITTHCDQSYDHKDPDSGHAYKLHGSADGDYAKFVMVPKTDGSDYFNLKVIGVSDDNTHATSFNRLTESSDVYLSTHALHFTSFTYDSGDNIADVKFSAENTLLMSQGNKHIVGWDAENIAMHSTSIGVTAVAFTEYTESRTFTYTSIHGVLPSSLVAVSSDNTANTVSYINIIEPITLLTFRSHADLNNGGLVRIVSEYPDRVSADNPNYVIDGGGRYRFSAVPTFTGDTGPIMYMNGPDIASVIANPSQGKPAELPFMAFPDGGFGFRFWNNRLRSLSSVNFSVGMVIKWCPYDWRNAYHGSYRSPPYGREYELNPWDVRPMTLICVGRGVGLVGVVISAVDAKTKLYVSLVGRDSEKSSPNSMEVDLNEYFHYYKTAVCVKTTGETIENGVAVTHVRYSFRSQTRRFDGTIYSPVEFLDIDHSFLKSDILAYENTEGNGSYLQTFSCVCNDLDAYGNDPACVAESRLVVDPNVTLDSLFASIQ